MNMILKVSLRNLIRQKRRNLFLGLGIAFGMSILMVANAFSHGMSELLLNKFILWITGHIRVSMAEKDLQRWDIIRDQERVKDVIRATIPGATIFEEVTAEGRALGKSTTGNVVLKGIEMDKAFFRELQIESGNPDDILNPNIENPVIVYSELADEVGLQINDVFQVQFQTAYRQMESARFTIVAIIKGDIPFIGQYVYAHINTLKPLLGYQPHESGALNIVLKDLKNPALVNELAEKLHQALQPGIAGYNGVAATDRGVMQSRVVAVREDGDARQQFAAKMTVTAGTLENAWTDANGIVISQAAADALSVTVGGTVSMAYDTRFEGISPSKAYRVSAIFKESGDADRDLVFTHPKAFDKTAIPLPPKTQVAVDASHALAALLMKEWNLLPRTATREALETKYEELEYADWHGELLDVQTMQELASDLLKLEMVLDGLAMVAVLALFFIIIIGVANTLRMTIRERTREIGTVRAIGMQQSDVRWSFLAETLLLTLIAGVAGIILGFVVILAFQFVSIEAYGILTMILVEKHLYFVPTLSDNLQNLLIILAISFLTAIFPANRAANMSVSEALRSYE